MSETRADRARAFWENLDLSVEECMVAFADSECAPLEAALREARWDLQRIDGLQPGPERRRALIDALAKIDAILTAARMEDTQK